MVCQWHRHHKPTVGHKFSVAAMVDQRIVGACIVGRPVSRELDPRKYIEVTRLVADGTPHVCSFLYATAARIAKEFGYEFIQTYILEEEPGTSVKAAGWEFSHWTKGGDWNNSKAYKGKRRTDQPMCRKQCWRKRLAISVLAAVTPQRIAVAA